MDIIIVNSAPPPSQLQIELDGRFSLKLRNILTRLKFDIQASLWVHTLTQALCILCPQAQGISFQLSIEKPLGLLDESIATLKQFVHEIL